jgi:ABC-type glycerol-3-phosphate transport system substrate-binding protein
MFLKPLALAGAMALAATGAAACDFQNTVPLKSLTAGFEAWKVVTTAMAKCGNVQAELDQEFRTKQPAAFAANPALYQIGGVANGTLVPLLKDGSIRPLDGLIAKYGQQLNQNQLVKIDGQTMAVAMMINAQHLMYRRDVFEQLGLGIPTTYGEMLDAAAKIKAAGLMEHPIGATTRTGWNLAQEFVNLFMGFGGSFFKNGAEPNVNTEAGAKALETLKAMTAYMDPEFLVADPTYVQRQMQQGKIAMTVLWASRAAAMNNAAESSVVGKVGFAAAPAAVAGGPSATTLWWDGIVIAKNITEQEAEAAFRVAMAGLKPEVIKAHNDAAVWLVDGYVANDIATGTIASLTKGAPAYPSSVPMGLMHTAIGDNIAPFLTGQASAAEVLGKVEAAYRTAAKEAGLIR